MIDKFASVGIVAIVSAVVMLAIGWFMNIGCIVSTMDGPVTGMFILRCIGIFVAPVGGVLGWL